MDDMQKPPAEIMLEVENLRNALNDSIPPKLLDRNLLIATWNIRNLEDITDKWQSGPEDSPPRDFHSLFCIAEILSHFDIVAIQEVKGNSRALRMIIERLGANWGLLLSDPSPGFRGNNERLAFLYDRRKVLPDGLVCELVLSDANDRAHARNHIMGQFARQPYVASFRSMKKRFTLINLHILWGRNEKDREPELREIAQLISKWAKGTVMWDKNFIVLGDCNIDVRGSRLHKAFTSTGLFSPEELLGATRVIHQKDGLPTKMYDQIAWFEGSSDLPALGLKFIQGGSFNFLPHVLRNRKIDLRKLSLMISDHFPLWAEFSVRD